MIPFKSFYQAMKLLPNRATQKLINGSLNLNTGLSKDNCWNVLFLTQ